MGGRACEEVAERGVGKEGEEGVVKEEGEEDVGKEEGEELPDGREIFH